MGPAPPLMTAHEYFRTPETVKPMELAFGALGVADSPSAYHQSLVIELFLRFASQRIAERVRLRRDEPIRSAVLPDFTATLEEIVLNDVARRL